MYLDRSRIASLPSNNTRTMIHYVWQVSFSAKDVRGIWHVCKPVYSPITNIKTCQYGVRVTTVWYAHAVGCAFDSTIIYFSSS